MNKKIKNIIVILLIAELIIVAAFGAAVYLLQSRIIANKKAEELRFALACFDENVAERNENLEYFESEYDAMFLSKAKQAAFYMDHLGEEEAETAALQNLANIMEVDELHVISAEGTIVASSCTPAIPLTAEHIHAAGNNCKETVGDKNFRSYAAPLKDGNYILMRSNADEFDAEMDELSSDMLLYTSSRLGFNGTIAVFDEEGSISYASKLDYVYEGDNIFEKGLSKDHLTENTLKKLKIEGSQYFISFKWLENEKVWLAFAIPQSSINNQVTATVIMLVFCFFCILSIFNIYLIFQYSQSLKDINREISHAAQKKEKVDINSLMRSHAKKLGRKAGVVVIIGTVIAFLLAVYLQNMSMISIVTSENNDHLLDIDFRLEFSSMNHNKLMSSAKKLLINKALTAAYIIGEEPDIRNTEDLDELNAALDSEYIVIFDQSGKEVVSNGRFVGIEISEEPDDPSYQLRNLMYGNTYVYTEPVTGEYSGEVHQDIGAAIKTDGEADGFVVISNNYERLNKLNAITNPRSVYESINLFTGVPVVIDAETKEIIFADGERIEGKDARNYGLKESEIRDRFNGFVTFVGSRYFATSEQRQDGSLIYLFVPKQFIGRGCVLFALIVCALMLIGLVLCAAINRLLVGKNLKKLLRGSIHVSKKEDEEDSYPYVDVVMPDGSVKRAISVLGRLSLRDVDWEIMSPEQKTATLLRVFVMILSLAGVVILLFKSSILFPNNSLLPYILNMEWERNVNIFSLTYCAFTVCVILMVAFILTKILNRLAIVANPKGETIIRMLKNLLKYISVIVGVFLCLSFIGVKVTTLLAGAGLLTLVIGLGAQSLISDVLNGLFIIFESDFQVGDIVTIGTFRGTVQEIGIRTTKIMNGGGDLKIIRNSTLNDILNMTRQNSRCRCEIMIEYKEDLNKTIEIFKNEFDVIRANVPEIVEGPEFGGVSELSDNGVKLLIFAYCNEKDRFACTFGINRELKLICERNNINIPFPQVVVHDGDK